MSDTTLNCNGPKAGKYNNKPLLERQRRARINKSLEEIKDLILTSLYKDDPTMLAEKRNERMDKAEILETAVDYIKHQVFLQHASRSTTTSSLPTPQAYEHLIDPRLHNLNIIPPPAAAAMVYTNYPVSKRLKINHSQPAQQWIGLPGCTDRCCTPHYYTNVSPMVSPTLCKTRGNDADNKEDRTTEQTIDKEGLEYSSAVWRPW